jgi:hypothetical protein
MALILISKSKDGRKAMFVEHTTDPISGKKSSVTKHLVKDGSTGMFVRYNAPKMTSTGKVEGAIREAVEL